MKKAITEKEIKRVVKEYMERMFKKFRTLESVSTDILIDCPKCKTIRNIQCEKYGQTHFWQCLRRYCGYAFPKELNPPSPEELEYWHKHQELEKRIKKFLE